MFKKKQTALVIILIIIAVFATTVLVEPNITGFAVWSSAPNGTYINTTWNNSIQLEYPNTEGIYISEIQDAENTAVWNNISWTQYLPVINESREFIPINAIHSRRGDVTSRVNVSDYGGSSTYSNVRRGEYIEVISWDSSVLSIVNISSVIARCDCGNTYSGNENRFQYNTNGTWSAEICAQQSGSGAYNFSCDLYAQGVDTPDEINNLKIRCLDYDYNGHSRSRERIDFIHVIVEYTASTDLKLQVRSNNESFIGPDRTNTTYYTNSSGEDLNMSNDRYFQYISYFSTEDMDYTSKLNDVIIQFTVIENTSGEETSTEQAQISGGSGGGSRREETITLIVCEEDWVCSSWSDCLPEGKQIRKCVDANRCGSVKSKPKESMDCVYSVDETASPSPITAATTRIIEGIIDNSAAVLPIIVVLITILGITLFPRKQKRSAVKSGLELEQWKVPYRIPFGYTNTTHGPTPNKDAKTVQDIFRYHKQGMSYDKIAKKTGLASRTKIWRIIKNNKFYEGYILKNGKWIKAHHKSIIN